MKKQLTIGLTALVLEGCSLFFRTPETNTTPIEPPKPQPTSQYSPEGEIAPVGRANLHKWASFLKDRPASVEYFCPANLAPWNVTARVDIYAPYTNLFDQDISPLESYVCKGTTKPDYSRRDYFIPRSCEGKVPTEVVELMKSLPVR